MTTVNPTSSPIIHSPHPTEVPESSSASQSSTSTLDNITQETFERIINQMATSSNVTGLDMPSADEYTELVNQLSSMPGEERSSLNNLLNALIQESAAQGADSPSAANAAHAVAEAAYNNGFNDPSDIQHVLMGHIGQASQDLQDIAQGMQDINESRSELRVSIRELQDELETEGLSSYTVMGPDGNEVTFTETTKEVPNLNADGSPILDDNGQPTTKTVTVSAQDNAKNTLAQWEEAYETLGDDKQMQQFEIQQALNEYTQAMTALSNIQKALNDAMMTVIRNLK